MGGLAMLVVTASLLGDGAGHVHAAVPGQRSSELTSLNNGAAKPKEHNVLWAAAPVPKVSVPQVHVNVGTHLQSPKIATPQVHVNVGMHLQSPKISAPQVHANVGTHANTSNLHSAIGVGGAHRLDKNNGSKGKGGNVKAGNANSGGMLLPIEGIKGESLDDGGHRLGSIPIQ